MSHFVLERLKEALTSNDLELAREIIYTNHAAFKALHPILFPGKTVTKLQVKMVKRLLEGAESFPMITEENPNEPVELINMYTEVLLDTKYSKQVDIQLAKAVEKIGSMWLFWSSKCVRDLRWKLEFHFHRALLRNALMRSKKQRVWWDKKRLLKEAQEYMPDLGEVFVSVLIDKLAHGRPFMGVLGIFSRVLSKGTGNMAMVDGPIDRVMVARLLHGDADAFKGYLDMDPMKLPVYIHNLFACVGKACLEESRIGLPRPCRAQIKAYLTSSPETFTEFLFRSNGLDVSIMFAQKWTQLLDYSRPEWNTPFGEDVYCSIFPPGFSFKEGNVEHIMCVAPKHLALIFLDCHQLTAKHLAGLPADRLLIYLREGAFTQSLLAEMSQARRKKKARLTDEEAIEDLHEIPDWLKYKDTDDDRLKVTKGLIFEEVHLRPMVMAFWEKGECRLHETVLKRIRDLLNSKLFPRQQRGAERYRKKPCIFKVYEWHRQTSPVLAYIHSLPGGLKSSIDNSPFVPDAFMCSGESQQIQDHFQTAENWHHIPDHVWYDPPGQVGVAETSDGLFFKMFFYDDTSCGNIEKVHQIIRTGLLAKTLLEGICLYPRPEYSQRMDMILEMIEDYYDFCKKVEKRHREMTEAIGQRWQIVFG